MFYNNAMQSNPVSGRLCIKYNLNNDSVLNFDSNLKDIGQLIGFCIAWAHSDSIKERFQFAVKVKNLIVQDDLPYASGLMLIFKKNNNICMCIAGSYTELIGPDPDARPDFITKKDSDYYHYNEPLSRSDHKIFLQNIINELTPANYSSISKEQFISVIDCWLDILNEWQTSINEKRNFYGLPYTIPPRKDDYSYGNHRIDTSYPSGKYIRYYGRPYRNDLGRIYRVSKTEFYST